MVRDTGDVDPTCSEMEHQFSREMSQIGVPNGLRRLDVAQTGFYEISARGDVRIVQSRNAVGHR